MGLYYLIFNSLCILNDSLASYQQVKSSQNRNLAIIYKTITTATIRFIVIVAIVVYKG